MSGGMELNHLKYFYHVVREGGFTRASERLRVAQPSISKMVRLLEDEVGTQLLERDTRGVRLTKAGRAVFEHCERIFQEIEELKRSVETETRSCQGPLELGAAEPIASWILPAVIHEFKSANPDAVPLVFTAPARAVFDRIESGKTEFGLFFHMPDAPESLRVERLAKMPFELVISTHHAKDAKVRASFIGSREVDDVTTRRFPTIEKMKKKWPETSIQISCNGLTAHKELVRLGAGVAILPRLMVAGELASGEFTRLLPKEEFVFDLKLVTRARGVLSRSAQVFLEHLRESLRSQAR